MKPGRPTTTWGLTGKVINGFTVLEMLGGCRSGNFYLATNPAGDRAVVRVVTGESDADTKLFLQEVLQFLGQNVNPRLVRTVLDDGTVIHLAIKPSLSRPTPRPTRAEPPPPSLRTYAGALAAFLALGCVAGLVTMRLLRPKPLPVVVLSSGQDCAPDAAWRATMHRELDGLAATLSAEALTRYNRESPIDIDGAQTTDDCTRVSAAIARLQTRYRAPCRVTSQWASERRRELAELVDRSPVPADEVEALQRTITTAATDADCLDVTASLRRLRTR